MTDNSVTIKVNGQDVLTLRDILPAEPGLLVLFVAKTPALKSVAAGHYFQGSQGKKFWSRLKEYGLLKPTTAFEDDSLVDHGYGLTDIVKVPRDYGNEPSTAEYVDGMVRILKLIRIHRPSVLVFVYKKVLDQVLARHFGVKRKSVYGFNPEFEKYFNSSVFAFPLPGTPCTSAQASAAMRELVETVGSR